MNTRSSKKKPRRTAHSYTWELRQNLLDLEDKVTAIIETIKVVNNGGYAKELNDRLEVANKKISERRTKTKPKDPPQEEKPEGGKPEGDQPEGDQPASENQPNAARRFQF